MWLKHCYLQGGENCRTAMPRPAPGPAAWPEFKGCRPADGQSMALGGQPLLQKAQEDYQKAANLNAGGPGCWVAKGGQGRRETFKARLLPNVAF